MQQPLVLPRDLTTHVAITQPVSDDASGKSENAQATAFNVSAMLDNEVRVPTLPASISSAIQLPAVMRSIETGDPEAEEGNTDLTAGPAKPFDPTTDIVPSQSDNSSTILQINPLSSATPPAIAASTLGALISNASPASRVADQTKAMDISKSATAITADTSVVAAQQGPGVLAQSVAAVSTPGPGPVDAVPPTPPIATGKGASANRFTETQKASAPRQTVSAAKGKAISPFSEARGKVASGDESDAQTASEPATETSFVKVPDTPVNTSHGTNSSQPTLDVAALQQVPQSASFTGPTHNTPLQQGSNASPEGAVQASPGQVTVDTKAMQGITGAQLTQSMRSSEMKLGMQSAEFGNISISTSLNHQAISAQISIDHSELGRALAVHLPAIEEKLGSAYGVQAKVELRESNNPSSNNPGYSSSGQQSREQRNSDRGGSASAQSSLFEQVVSRAGLTVAPVTASSSRLDIRI